MKLISKITQHIICLFFVFFLGVGMVAIQIVPEMKIVYEITGRGILGILVLLCFITTCWFYYDEYIKRR